MFDSGKERNTYFQGSSTFSVPNVEQQEKYWLNALEDGLFTLTIPSDFNMTDSRMPKRECIKKLYDSGFRQKLSQAAADLCLSEQIIMIAALMLLLKKHTWNKEIVFGNGVFLQSHNGKDTRLRENILVLKGYPEEEKSIAGFLSEIKNLYEKAYENKDYPFYRLASLKNLDFNSMLLSCILFYFNSRSEFEEMEKEIAGIRIEDTEAAPGISIYVIDEGNGHTVTFYYRSDLYTQESICYMQEHYETIINQIVDAPEKLIKEIGGIREPEKIKVTEAFNDTLSHLPQWHHAGMSERKALSQSLIYGSTADQSALCNGSKCEEKNITIIDLFERQVSQDPERTAVVFKNDKLTYGQLNAKANCLGIYLRNACIGPDDFVALITDRSFEMVIGIYGILKAGGAYVPIDPAYPDDRISYIIKDCKPKAVLLYGNKKGKSFAKRIKRLLAEEEIQTPVIDLQDMDFGEGIAENPKKTAKPENLLYCIYTSGTTGNPKGVLIEHKNVLYYVNESDRSIYGGVINRNHKKILGVTTMSFDIFVTEIILPLVHGMEICLVGDEEQNDAPKIAEIIEKNEVEVLQATPSRMKLYLAGTKDKSYLKKLKIILMGGENIPDSLCRELREYTDAKLFNGYGPSEATVCATVTELKETDLKVTIGKPLAKVKIYILSGMQLCGIGMPGELCIAGDGLARGYLNRDELNREKFIADPFGGGKLYRTGDLARWLPDGNIDFLGRIDEQVKVRGFRIELGEIESVIKEIEWVTDAVVIVRANQDGDNELYAYIVAADTVNIREIHNCLSKRLPYYMVPDYMQQIEAIPVTRNGKIDKRRLPEIRDICTGEYTAPTDETEEKICRIFGEVLGTDRVGMKDNFFRMGGHSLKAAKLINRIEAELGCQVSFPDVFVNNTPELLVKLIRTAGKSRYEPISKSREKEFYKMAPAQKRMYYSQLLSNDTVYNLPESYLLTGDISVDKLRNAVKQLLDRHEILRTEFLVHEEEPVQRIHKEAADILEYEEDAVTEEKELIRVFIRPFDLGKPSQIRIKLIKRLAHYLLFIDMHHIISDGMSRGILMNELMALYHGKMLPPPEHQYRDYSEWVVKRDVTAQKEYWLKEFYGELPVLELPYDFTRPKTQSYMGDVVLRTLDKNLKEAVDSLARTTQTTEYMILLSALMVTLSKYSRQEEIIVGSVVSGRIHKDTENIPGMFVNTLAMKGRPEQDKSYGQFLLEMKQVCLNAFMNQEYPFEELAEEKKVRRDVSRNPIFDVMFVLQNNDDLKLDLNGSPVLQIPVSDGIAKFDITVEIIVKEEGYQINFTYCRALFYKKTIRNILERYEAILKEIVAEPDKKIGKLTGISSSERELILNTFNRTESDYGKEKTITHIWKEQVNKYKDSTAVIWEDKGITYKELDQRTDSLAFLLRDLGVDRDDFVVIAADKSIEVIEGILGIIKAGGAYVPVDLTYPAERIRFILGDCSPKALLLYEKESSSFTDKMKEILKEAALEIPIIDLKGKNLWEGSTKELTVRNQAGDLAYCIYTSGTTGNPKGSLIEHKSVIRLVKNTNYITLNPDTVILQTGSISFDASTFEIWGALLNGGKLVLSGLEVITSTDKLKECLYANHVNTMWMTSMLFNQLFMLDNELFDTLKYMLIGGEKLSEEHVRLFKNRKNNVRLINGYGPTENTTFTTTYEIPEVFDKIPIGRPISNTKVFVMRDMELCGIGVPGELCCAGDGVARGYLNREKLTGEKFVENPFGEGKLYLTGDLVRWLPDGTIDYLGRMDDQVKIRGFRIELSEIEECLKKLPDMKDAAVIAKNNTTGEKAIYAYLVSDTGMNLTDVREQLQKQLPEYMVPGYMMQIDQLPLTHNGKLDKQALPEIMAESTLAYEAPTNKEEEIVCRLFGEILNVGRAGRLDSFFELGGDSIKAIRAVSRIRDFGYSCTVKDIMDGKTAVSIAKRMFKQKKAVYSQDEITGYVESTPIIRWFLEQDLKVTGHFNQSILLKTDRFDRTALKAALDHLIVQHDMLRSVFKNNRLSIASVKESKGYDYAEYEYGSLEKEQLEDFIGQMEGKLQEEINLWDGPIMKTALFTGSAEEHLLIIIHHLAVDGVSLRILTEDIQNAYEDYKKYKKIRSTAKTASFKEWSENLKEYEQESILSAEKSYWEKIEESMALCGRLQNKWEPGELKNAEFKLDKEHTFHLIHDCGKAFYTRVPDLLTAALGKAIYSLTGNQKVVIGMEGHGREEIHKRMDIDRTVGWFTSCYPVFMEVREAEAANLIETKEMFRRIPNNGMGYSVLRYGFLKTLGGGPAEVVFNYHGEFHEDEENREIKHSEFSCKHDISPLNTLKSGIMIDGLLKEGEITFQILYDSGRYTEDRIRTLAGAYKACLFNLIQCCVKAAVNPTKTASDYGLKGIGCQDFENIRRRLSDMGVTPKDIYKLTPLQEGMLLSQIDAVQGEYFVQSYYQCTENINYHHVKDALVLLAGKEEVLKTLFLYEGLSEPVQVIAEERYPELKEVMAGSEQETEEALQSILSQDVKRGFDLEKDSLLRVTLVKKGERYVYMIWSMHHIITDGWSMPLLWNRFMELYRRILRGEKTQDLLKEISDGKAGEKTYGDYIRHLTYKNREEGLKFWKDQLEGYEGHAFFEPSGDKTITEEPVFVLEQKLSRDSTDKIIKEGSKNGITVNTYVETAIGIVLSHYNNTDDVVYGKVVSGREAEVAGIEEMTGMFINTIPQRIRVEDNMTAGELLEKVQKQSVDSTKYSYIGLSDIQNFAVSGENLIHTVLAFENYYMAERVHTESDNASKNLAAFKDDTAYKNDAACKEHAAEKENTTKENYIAENGFRLLGSREQTNYDLDFTACLTDSLNLMVSYQPEKYGEREIRQILERLLMVLEQMAEYPWKKVGELETVTKEEQSIILKDFNSLAKEYPSDKTVMDLFEEQAAKTPDRIAVVYNQETITYGELNRKANHAAKLLKDLGIAAEDLVAVFAERRIEMIIGIYGILKAGGAYVPFPSDYPEERIRFMLKDCGAKAVLTACSGEVFTAGLPVIDLLNENIYKGEAVNPKREINGNNLAYVIYTSGTTGNPKGVLIEHKGLANLMAAYSDIYELTEKDVVLQAANYIFDQSVWDIFHILLIGGRLCLISYDDLRNPEALKDYCNEKGVTLASFTPALINELDPLAFKTLRLLDSSGEAANGDVLKRWAGRVKVINTYGPTETTVNASSYVYTGEDLKRLPIGGPLPNTQFYILKGNRLCGIGIPGELCIAGDGVARGYLNRTELTQEKFTDNPFGKGKLYHTGDLARWLPDGTVDCMGRMDEQVKIRGFRIELGDVISAIRKLSPVKDAAVIVKSGMKGEKAMYAYLVSEQELMLTAIKEELRKTLPSYMIPAYMIQIPEIPVTRSGKIDRRALPDIRPERQETFVLPATQAEEMAAKIFQLILDLDRVGANEDFFELGGDSIKAIRVVSKLREAGYPCAVKDILSERTVSGIAARLMRKKEGSAVFQRIPVCGRVEPTPIIRNFIRQNLKKPEHYNQSMMIKTVRFHREAIKAALRELVIHHDMLRAVYKKGELSVRSLKEGSLYDYREYDVSNLSREETGDYIMNQGTRLQESINLPEGPLVKAALFMTGEEEHLLLVIHHLVVDGISWRILLEDLETGYEQYQQKGSICLPQKTASFLDWSRLLKEYGSSKKLLKEKKYWETITRALKECRLEKQLEGKSCPDIVTTELEEVQTHKLLYESSKAYHTRINDLLLAGLGMAFYEVTGRSRIAVEMEGHGREEIHQEIQVDRTVGWFTSYYPVILRTGEDTAENIIQTKEMFRNIPNNGIGYGVLKSRGDDADKEDPLDIAFNYLGDFHEKREAGNGFLTSEYKGGMDDAPENGLENSISITGITQEKKLRFSIGYDAGKYEKRWIEKIAAAYKRNLIKIIECCEKAETATKTASDFNMKGDAKKDFDKALTILKGLLN